MIVKIEVPHVGESITEGVLAVWHKQNGDFVKPEDPLFDLETDKITAPVMAEHAGRLAILAAEGATVAIGQVVATIDTEAKPGDAPPPPPPPAPEAKQAAPAPAVARVSSPPAAPARAAEAEDEAAGLSPAVRRLIEEHGLDAAAIPGTGKGGRITKADVMKYLEERPAGAARAAAAAKEEDASEQTLFSPSAPSPVRPAPASAPAGAREIRKPMTQLRKRIAQRLLESQRQTATVTTFTECDMTKALEIRDRWRESFEKKYNARLGFMSFFVKAVVDALKFMPDLNARIEGDDIVYHQFLDVGIAVSTDQGLVVPIIRDADSLSLAETELKIAELARRARERRLTLEDLSGGSISITNGGVFGSLLSTPILNPPQSAIVGVHTIQKRPVAINDEIVIRPMMYLALSYDHRLVDGREGVLFLKRVAECITDPERMFLEV